MPLFSNKYVIQFFISHEVIKVRWCSKWNTYVQVHKLELQKGEPRTQNLHRSSSEARLKFSFYRYRRALSSTLFYCSRSSIDSEMKRSTVQFSGTPAAFPSSQRLLCFDTELFQVSFVAESRRAAKSNEMGELRSSQLRSATSSISDIFSVPSVRSSLSRPAVFPWP